MLFNSLEFAAFFPLVLVAYALSPARARRLLLLLASYLFYAGWNPAYLPLIWASTAVDFTVGLKMGRETRRGRRRAWLLLSLATNLGLLFSFKYYNFFAGVVGPSLEAAGVALPVSHLLLPVGISFYTFQTLSYTIDVYRGKLEPQKDLIRFSLFVAFFPQLVAGPIERAKRLLPQLESLRAIDPDRLVSGLRLIAWGLFKKVVIADRLAIYVNSIYGDPAGYGGGTLLLATYFFAFQIYCDFSGYSDIAIGCARIFGIDLMRNFDLPYLATSISDFWKRWHISLSTWFRDYVYIPLGGNQVGASRWLANVMIVFVVSGLWHGAAWTFVVWGGLHGIYYLGESVIRRALKGRGDWTRSVGAQWLSRVVTFHLVLLAWIFFRAPSLPEAGEIVRRIVFEPWGRIYLGASATDTLLGAALILMLVVVQWLQWSGRLPMDRRAVEVPVWLRWPVYVAGTICLLLLGTSANDFIYFQF